MTKREKMKTMTTAPQISKSHYCKVVTQLQLLSSRNISIKFHYVCTLPFEEHLAQRQCMPNAK